MKANIDVFDRDAAANAGYVYTTNDRLSTRLATRRLADLLLEAVPTEDRSVVDIGCGDGYFTDIYFREGHPRSIAGLDPVPSAVAVACSRIEGRPIRFVVGDGHRLPWPSDSFDLAVIHCVLHHDDDAPGIIREALRLAPEAVVVDPNGNNLGLKVIEKASRYHREHEERSYPSRRMLRWIEGAGGVVTSTKFAGLVPFFCPDPVARFAKALEPAVERSRILSWLGCAVYVMVVRRVGDRP